MPYTREVYMCKYCEKEYSDQKECAEHERTHLHNYRQENTKEIIRVLRELGEIAGNYHIGDMVLGMPVSNFESLMSEAAERLEEGERYGAEKSNL